MSWLLVLAACADPVVHDSSYQRFEADVLDVLERRCGLGCHAVPQDEYVAMLEDPAHREAFYFPVDPATGRFSDEVELRRMAFDVTRGAWWEEEAGHGEEPGRIDYEASPEFSHLLRAPLAVRAGGTQHRGVDVFTTEDEPDYRSLAAWVAAEIEETGLHAPTWTPAEEYFRDEVVGVLQRNGCFIGSCHGEAVFNDLKLQAPLPQLETGAPARLSPAMLRAARRQVLGTVSRLVHLEGDPRLSRLLVKNLPIEQGGVHQRGGNLQFFESLEDPDVVLLLRWIAMERAALAARLTSGGDPIPEPDLGRLQGVAFLRGPRHAPRRFFDVETFWPGTRLMVLPDGAAEPVDLLPEVQGEIQAFDVRYDARAIVFALRPSADEGFRIWEVELTDDLRAAEGTLRQLSFGPDRLDDGGLVHHVDPIYVPGPTDPDGVALDDVAVTFSSNAAGGWASSDTWGLVGEADGGAPGRLVDRQRFEAPGTFDGVGLTVVAGPMRGERRTIERHEPGGELVLDTPLPAAPDASTVYVIDADPPDPRPAFDIWSFVPGAWSESARPQTFRQVQDRRPTLRTTGEVMFTSLRNRGYQSDRPVFNAAIFRTHAGGFDYHIQGGNRSGWPVLADSWELPSGLEIRLATDPRNVTGGGLLLLVDHGFGVDIEPDNPVDHLAWTSGDEPPVSSSQGFLPAQVPLFPRAGADAVTPTGVSPGGSFRDPYPHSDGTVFVARVGAVDHLDPDADPDWDLARIRFDGPLKALDGRSVGPLDVEPLHAANSGAAEYHPRPIAVRLKEKPVTHQKFAARSDGLAPRREHGVLRLPQGLTGEIECYDYPLLQSFLGSFTPVGERDFRDDDLAAVRIVQRLPLSRADLARVDAADPFATAVGSGVHPAQRIVSEVPLEADGSFYAEVPTEVPLILQGLDAQGRALQSMSRWFYVQPGEKLTFSIPRSIFPTRCAGCHGSLTGDRVDALGPPDLVSASSRVMATWDPVLGQRRPPAPVAPLAVDFVRDVQPILDVHCVRCHGADDPAAGVPLVGDPDGPWSVAYRSLHVRSDPAGGDFADKRYVNEREGLSSQSFLVELLLGVELDAPQTLPEPGVPHPLGDPLDDDELLTITRWIDLGATFVGGDP